MKRTSLFLPEGLMARLAAESARTGTAVAELIRRAVDAATPPIGVSMGELRRLVDRTGLLRVFVLDARVGQLLVEPDDNKLQGQIQIWVDANLVEFQGIRSVNPILLDSARTDAPEIRANYKTPEEKS
jgi:hypothetical protein